MNDAFKKSSAAFEQLADFLKESIRTGVIPSQHHAAADTIVAAERSGLLYALEAIHQLPKDEPLQSLFSLIASKIQFTPLLVSNSPNASMTFDNYVSCDVNKLSIKLAHSLIKGTSHVDLLFLYGDSGQGKTHLLNAIANAMGDKALYANVMDFGLEIVRANKSGVLSELLHWLYQFQTILFDDFESVSGRDKLQSELFGILKGAAVRNIPVVIGSTRKLSKIPGVDVKLTALINHGVTAKLQLPDRDKLCLIAQQRAGSVTLPPEVIDYLTENIKDNVHHLVGAVRQIIALSEQTDTPITIDLARAVAPMEQDLKAAIPNLDPELVNVFSSNVIGDDSDGASEEQQQKARMFKEMLASAQNEEEQCLALQIALSERIKELRANGDTEEIGKLKVALSHLRSGKIREALDSAVL